MADEYESDTGDEPQQLSLREKAESLTPYKRPPHVENGHLGDDKVLVADEDNIVWHSDHNEPKFRSHGDAAESLQQEREAAREQQAETEIADTAEFERDWRAMQSERSGWNTPEEREALSQYQERMQRWQGADAQLKQSFKAVDERVRELNAGGHHVEAKIVADRYIAAASAAEAERTWLVRRAQEGERHVAKKQQQVGQHELLRIAPGLADNTTRESFLTWLAKEHGVPRSHAEREQNPQMIARYYRQYEKHEQEMYRQLARKQIAKTIPTTRRMGGGSPLTSSADARKALREGGKPSDALELLALRKMEKRYGL